MISDNLSPVACVPKPIGFTNRAMEAMDRSWDEAGRRLQQQNVRPEINFGNFVKDEQKILAWRELPSKHDFILEGDWTPLGEQVEKSKNQIQAPRVARKAWTAMACPLMEMSGRDFPLAPAAERPAKEEMTMKAEDLLCSLGVTVDPASGYRRVRSVMDSGATKGVMHPNSFPDFVVQPSPGSKRGAVFGTAGSDELPNLGMWNLPAISAEGEKTMLKTQVAEVSLPLSSVGETCDEGNLVIFSAKGGLVCNVTTGDVKRFGREQGMYILEQWVPPASVFARPK